MQIASGPRVSSTTAPTHLRISACGVRCAQRTRQGKGDTSRGRGLGEEKRPWSRLDCPDAGPVMRRQHAQNTRVRSGLTEFHIFEARPFCGVTSWLRCGGGTIVGRYRDAERRLVEKHASWCQHRRRPMMAPPLAVASIAMVERSHGTPANGDIRVMGPTGGR